MTTIACAINIIHSLLIDFTVGGSSRLGFQMGSLLERLNPVRGPVSTDHGRKSAEYRSFKEHFAVLFEGIQDPVTLSARLFSAGLLDRETRRTICSLERPAQQMSKLLDAVEGQIIMDPQNFYKFVDELKKDRPMQHLCDKLRFTCGE